MLDKAVYSAFESTLNSSIVSYGKPITLTNQSVYQLLVHKLRPIQRRRPLDGLWPNSTSSHSRKIGKQQAHDTQWTVVHLFDEVVIVLVALFVITNEVPQFALLVLQRAVQLFHLTNKVCLLRRQTLPVGFHRYKYHKCQSTNSHRSLRGSTAKHSIYRLLTNLTNCD